MSETGRGTIGEVKDGLGRFGRLWGGSGQVGGPSKRSVMGRGICGEVRDELRDPRGGP